MNAARIALSATWFDERELDRVREALGGRVAGDGPFAHKVETRLAERLNVPRVLLTTSCTHALELALMALGVGPGDEVICPSFTFVSTANAVLRVGARPVFADIEGETLGLDVADAARVITERTRAVLPIHYGGVAPDMDALADLVRPRGIRIVEDAAQGLGASYRGRALGTLGDAGCFSFHETKNVTCGEGGALALADPDIAARAEIVREKGTNRRAFLRGEIDKYTWVMEGSSYVLSDILAAVLDAQLDKEPEIAARRASIAERYHSELADWAGRAGVGLPPRYDDRVPNHHIFYLLFAAPDDRDRAMAALQAAGVGATFHYIPLHSAPRGRALHDGRALPVTDRIASTLLRLPIHPGLAEGDVARVIDAVRRCLDR